MKINRGRKIDAERYKFRVRECLGLHNCCQKSKILVSTWILSKEKLYVLNSSSTLVDTAYYPITSQVEIHVDYWGKLEDH